MPVGVELKRDGDQSLILSNNLRNPVVVGKGVVAAGGAPTLGGFGSGVVVPATGMIRAIQTTHGLGRWTTNNLIGPDPAPYNATYFHFADTVADNTTVGLEIYADDGPHTVMFSTHPNNKPLRVIEVFGDVGHPPGGSGGADVTLADYTAMISAGRTLAFAQGLYAGSQEWENFALNTGTGFADELYWAKINYARAFYITAAGLLKATYVRTDPPTASFAGDGPHVAAPGANTFFDNAQVMVIDVTGY